MRLLADENLHAGIIQGLRRANFEVIFAPDIEVLHREEEILGRAQTIAVVLSEAGYRIHKPGGSTG
jgi:hypothetical protein